MTTATNKDKPAKTAKTTPKQPPPKPAPAAPDNPKPSKPKPDQPKAAKQLKTAGIKPHPFSLLVPRPTAAERESLKADIIANGVRDKGLLYENQSLDGSTRLGICQELEIEWPHDIFKGTPDQAKAVVLSKANHRHLSESQRAALAVHFLPLLEAQAKERMLKGTANVPEGRSGLVSIHGKTREEWFEHYNRKSQHAEVFRIYREHVLKDLDAEDGSGRSLEMMSRQIIAARFGDKQVKGEAREQAGAMLGVSAKSVSNAKALYKANRKLFNEVHSGETKLGRAIAEIKRTQKRETHRKLAAVAPDVDSVKINTGDCITGMVNLPSGFARFAFHDPQYNIGLDYGKGAKADLLPRDEYLNNVRQWTRETHRILTPDGSMMIVCDWSYLADIVMILRGGYDGLPIWHERNIICWPEGFGVQQTHNYSNCWRPIIHVTKSKTDFVFHGDLILTPSARITKYGDKRGDPAGKVPSNVWEIPRLVGNADERVAEDFKTQLPIGVLERAILAHSEPGDYIFDGFVGSGTTPLVAALLGRKFEGFEIDPDRAEAARRRVKVDFANHRAEAGNAKPAKGGSDVSV